MANLGLAKSPGQIIYPQKPQGAANFQFNITPGAQGSETMDFTPSGVVVTNPYNYYIYFPGANQWVAPRAYNFIFAYSPVPPGIKWDTTKDPFGNAQLPNTSLIANAIATTDTNSYSGGSVSPPGFGASYAFLANKTGIGYNSGIQQFVFPINQGANDSVTIPISLSIYQIQVVISLLGLSSVASEIAVAVSLGLTDGVNVYPNVMQVLGAYMTFNGSQALSPVVVTYVPPQPVSSSLLGITAINGVVLDVVTPGGAWASGTSIDLLALGTIVAG